METEHDTGDFAAPSLAALLPAGLDESWTPPKPKEPKPCPAGPLPELRLTRAAEALRTCLTGRTPRDPPEDAELAALGRSLRDSLDHEDEEREQIMHLQARILDNLFLRIVANTGDSFFDAHRLDMSLRAQKQCRHVFESLQRMRVIEAALARRAAVSAPGDAGQ